VVWAASAAGWSGPADPGAAAVPPVTGPAYFGDVLIDRESAAFDMPPVVFPHWLHRTRFTCRVCHPAIFEMRAGAHEISMTKISDGYFCGTCHDGTVAWRPVDCVRCHSGGEVGAAAWSARGPRASLLPVPNAPPSTTNHDPHAALAAFPRDTGGHVDWLAAAEGGLIAPARALPSAAATSEPSSAAAHIRMPRTGELPAVIFPHASHSALLDCSSCHPDPFARTAGAHRSTMVDMEQGRSCGKCHGHVSFPLEACDRCHLWDEEGAEP